MPDVSRSDSQRSDASQKPRVSFNRDVHVKRIVPREDSSPVGAVSGDGIRTPFVASPVRKERLKKSKKELSEEAKHVLHQVDRLGCATSGNGVSAERFYTLPHRKKKKEYFSGSLERRTKRRNSLELLPPKKPPRTFATNNTPKSSIFDIFKKDKSPSKKSNLRRSASDVSNSKVQVQKFRARSGSDSEDLVRRRSEKKQLSPIIEVSQREDYFSAPEFDRSEKENKENIEPKSFVRKKQKDSITAQLKQFIDEIDEELYKETGIRPTPAEEKKPPQPIIIDVDKAQQISGKGKTFKNSLLGRKLKFITNKKKNTNEANKNKKSKNKAKETTPSPKEEHIDKAEPGDHTDAIPGPQIKKTIEHLTHPKNSPKMIHSSQMPAEKLPLTKGRMVNNMVKRLSYDSTSPPPLKTNVMVSHNSVQHNNNQPFSYTRGLSPEKCMSNESSPTPGSPIIYAQVVCGANGKSSSKQTIHTAYNTGKKHSQSDSDEGLGGEEHLGFKSVTHFQNGVDEVDKFEEESPITPKFRNLNGYSSYERKERSHTRYVDSSARGRGDGMDSKRRESLTEPHENTFTSTNLFNGRTDLATRRDQLESRINRRVNDNSLRTSPEYLKNSYPSNVYVSETTSKYYKGRSSSPVGYTQKYVSELKSDKYGQSQAKESRSMQYFGEYNEQSDYENRLKSNGYPNNGFDSEPKSFDSHVSSSPEYRRYETSQNGKRDENRTFHKSTPDIYYRSHQDSLKRENVERRTASSNYRSDYLEENDRRERFVDSGIENDFRRDSGDNFKSRPKHRRDYESEDEGFASSLLIASERQHTEDNVNHRRRRDYDSDRAVSREDDPYRNVENMDYKEKFRGNDYAPRERSIDDGSHYDPRIDKDVEVYTLRRSEKKPPKPEKKSSLEKVKSLFTRDPKKKKEKNHASHGMVREESLRARYIEYKGREPVEPKYRKQEVNKQANFDYTNRRRLSTPSPSPTREGPRNGKVESTHGSWFKSLDRLSRKKSKKGEKDGSFTSGTEEEIPTKPTKNLRFFGDTDQESNDSLRHKSSNKTRTGMHLKSKSQSTRELHNISEDFKSPRSSYKSMTNISESEKETKSSRSNLKPPMSPSHRTPSRETSRHDKDRSRRRKNEVSSVESSTEGDSSQQSQRSIVYLHAATVGDIPGPGYLKSGRRAASREELASNGSRVQQVKTLSRSFSVLAPWKPRHSREQLDIDYTQQPKNNKNGKFEQKPYKSTSSRKDSSSTLKKKAQESRKNQNGSTLLKLSKSRENLASQTLGRSRDELSKGSNSTLYKKKERPPKEHSRYNRDKEDKKLSSKSLSTESLGGQGRHREAKEISRSVSMPRNPEKSAGWFKGSKK